MSWDAGTYERVADPQAGWADEIIARSGIRHRGNWQFAGPEETAVDYVRLTMEATA